MTKRKKRHTPEQIIRKLREADAMFSAGKSIGQVCQAPAISEPTFHRWRNRAPPGRVVRGDEGCGGEASQRVGDREFASEEVGRRFVIGQGGSSGGVSGKILSPARRRQAVEHVQREKDVSQRRACEVLKQPRSTQRYGSEKKNGEEEKKLVARMHELVRQYPRYGYRFITGKLRQEGWRVNFKRVSRLWRREGFKVPKKTRKKRRLGHSGNSCVRRRAEHKDHVWAWDFIHDRAASGQPLKWLAIVDEYTRECLALEVDRSITADRVLEILTKLFVARGVPAHIRSDNAARGGLKSPYGARSSLRRRFRSTPSAPDWRCCTSNRVRRGRTAMRSRSSAGCGTSC